MPDDSDDEGEDLEQDPDDPDFLPAGMPKAVLPPRVPQPRNASRLSLSGQKRNCHGVPQASLERFRSDGAGPSNPLPVQPSDGLVEARNVIAAGMARMAAEIQARAPRQPPQAEAVALDPAPRPLLLAQAASLGSAPQPLQDQAAALDSVPRQPQQVQAAALDPAPPQPQLAVAPQQPMQGQAQAWAPAQPLPLQAEALQPQPAQGGPQPNPDSHGTVFSVCLVNPLGAILRCNHLFCVPCFTHLKELRRPCPMCRKAFRNWKIVLP